MTQSPMKLKHLLVSAFLVLSVVPLALGLRFLTDNTAAQLNQQVEEKLTAISEIEKKRILAAIDRVKDSTAMVQSRTQMRLSLDAYNQTGGAEHLAKLERILLDAADDVSRIRHLTLLNPDGQMVLSTDGVSRTISAQQRPGADTLVSLAMEDEPVLVSKSQLTLDGKVIGFIQVAFASSFLLEELQDRSGLGETGEWLIAVRGTDGGALFAVPLRYDQAAAFQRYVPPERQDVPIVQAMQGKEVLLRSAPDYRGVPVIAATRYLPELDLGLVAKIDEAEIAATVREANRLIIFIALFIVVLSILFGVLLAYHIARPVETLRSKTDQLARGDFNVKPLKRGWREVKDLSESFADMAQAIKDLSDNLNKKVRDRTEELDAANKKLMEIAVRDPLTGLYNRRFFAERFGEEFDRAKRYDTPLSLVMMDIDYFKKVNDTWGHGAGDKVLINVADFLRKTKRESDVLARLGGEEFCLLMPADAGVAMLAAERMRGELASLVHDYGDVTIEVTCSFGIAVVEEGVGNTADLMSRADEALYLAKKGGRNKVMLYQSPSSRVSDQPSAQSPGRTSGGAPVRLATERPSGRPSSR